jgi:ankyrin repeat protein
MANNVEKANFVMDNLGREDMLESAGFTTQDASGNGLLQIASLNSHLEMLMILLNRGININAVDRNHGTALQAAIYMGHESVYRELLEATKGKLNVNTKGGCYGCALQVAAYRANSKVVNKLIEVGAKVSISGGKYGYPLQAAVRTGSMSVVRPILSQAGIDVNAKGGRYGTALQAVARGEYRTRIALPEISRGQVLKQLAKNSEGEPVARVDKDPAAAGYVKVAEALFEKGALLDGGSGTLDNPINAAACSGSKEILKLMLDNFKDKSKRSKTWEENDSDILTKALLTAITQSPKNQKDLVELLVERGAKIQYVPSAALPNLPLEAAATRNLLPVVEYLLIVRDNFGNIADTLAVSGIHGTALRAAIAGAALNSDNEKVAACLIYNIAEQWGVKDRSPSSPADTSVSGGGLSTEVGEPSTQIPIRRDTGNKELDWTLRDAEYGNLLQLATFSGLKKTVSLLLEYGAGPNILDTSQRTSLHIAAWSGFPQIVELLLKKGADATLKDEWGATPLDQAEESLDREGHPGATELDLQRVIQILRGEMGATDSEKPGMEFHGPKRNLPATGKETKASPEPLLAKPVFSMPFWIPGVGFRATIIDFWETDNQERLLLKKPRIEEILYHKAVLDGIMTPHGKTEKRENKLRWIHLPTNNVSIIAFPLSSMEDLY